MLSEREKERERESSSYTRQISECEFVGLVDHCAVFTGCANGNSDTAYVDQVIHVKGVICSNLYLSAFTLDAGHLVPVRKDHMNTASTYVPPFWSHFLPSFFCPRFVPRLRSPWIFVPPLQSHFMPPLFHSIMRYHSFICIYL